MATQKIVSRWNSGTVLFERSQPGTRTARGMEATKKFIAEHGGAAS